MASFGVVLVTASSRREAEKVALILLKEKLAACVNIVPKIASRYWWKGRIEKASELLLIIKTQTSLFRRLTARIKKIHSYTVPEIIALPIAQGNPAYLAWIRDSLR